MSSGPTYRRRATRSSISGLLRRHGPASVALRYVSSPSCRDHSDRHAACCVAWSTRTRDSVFVYNTWGLDQAVREELSKLLSTVRRGRHRQRRRVDARFEGGVRARRLRRAHRFRC